MTANNPMPVDASPATGWSEPRPADLSPRLWAGSRPTLEVIAQLGLPDGTARYGADGDLLFWDSTPDWNGDLGELWLRCARQFPSTGLWPVCDVYFDLGPYRGWERLRADGRPYWSAPYAVPRDVYDAANVPDRCDYFQDQGQDLEDFRQLLRDFDLTETDMALAEASTLSDDPLERLVIPDQPRRLTLVACRRPADAVLLLDFGVPNDDATPGIFTGVLRSWEARFGVVPVMLQPAGTSFQVLAPPSEQTQIERLAVEIFSFAVDSGVQGGFYTRGRHSVSARELARSHEWHIWWD